MDGQHIELRGWTAPEMTVEQARAAGRSAARKQWDIADREQDGVPMHDAYEALQLYVVAEAAEGMAKHSLLADEFCDAYDAEIELQARRFER
jgi:hypothetical protein